MATTKRSWWWVGMDLVFLVAFIAALLGGFIAFGQGYEDFAEMPCENQWKTKEYTAEWVVCEAPKCDMERINELQRELTALLAQCTETDDGKEEGKCAGEGKLKTHQSCPCKAGEAEDEAGREQAEEKGHSGCHPAQEERRQEKAWPCGFHPQEER